MSDMRGMRRVLTGVGIVPGTIVESHRDAETEADKLLNVCYFIDHQGKIAGKYR